MDTLRLGAAFRMPPICSKSLLAESCSRPLLSNDRFERANVCFKFPLEMAFVIRSAMLPGAKLRRERSGVLALCPVWVSVPSAVPPAAGVRLELVESPQTPSAPAMTNATAHFIPLLVWCGATEPLGMEAAGAFPGV